MPHIDQNSFVGMIVKPNISLSRILNILGCRLQIQLLPICEYYIIIYTFYSIKLK